ncbi:MAG: hypothetical protein AABW99_02045 [archaeon]
MLNAKSLMVIFFVVALAAAANSEAPKSFMVGLAHDPSVGSTKISGVSVVGFTYGANNYSAGLEWLELAVFDEKGKKLSENRFNIPEIVYEPPAPGAAEVPESGAAFEFQAQVGYSDSAAFIKLFDSQGKELDTYAVGYLTNSCGDNVCEMHEDYRSCASDCRSGGKDNYCDGIKDSVCDPDCVQSTDADCAGKIPGPREQGGFSVPPEAIAVVLLVLIIAGGFIFAKRKRIF